VRKPEIGIIMGSQSDWPTMKLAAEILEELPEFRLSQVVIRERKVYRDAMAEGKGVVEMDNEKASDEINRLASEIFETGGEG